MEIYPAPSNNTSLDIISQISDDIGAVQRDCRQQQTEMVSNTLEI